MAKVWDWLMPQLLHDPANEDVFKIFLLLTIFGMFMPSTRGFASCDGGDGGC